MSNKYKYKLKETKPGTWRNNRTREEKDFWHVILTVECDLDTPQEVLEWCKSDFIEPYGDLKMLSKEEINRVLFWGEGDYNECFNVLISYKDDNVWQLDLFCRHFHKYAPSVLKM